MPDPRINYRITATDQVSRTLGQIDGRLHRLSQSFKSFGGFVGFATVAATVRSLTTNLLTLGSELQDASDKLGISAQSLQVLRRVAEESGASFDQLQTSLAFNVKLTEKAAAGNKEAAETFRQLGLDAQRFASLSLEDRFRVLAQQISSVEDPAERLALTLKSFGRGGAELAGVMKQTAAELDAVSAKVAATSGILSDDQVKALDEAGEAWERFASRLKAAAAPALTGAIGLIEKAGEALTALNEQRLFLTNEGFEIVPKITKGPQSRRRGGVLSPDEAAAIVGAPNRRDVDAALKGLRESLTEFDDWLDTRSAGAQAAKRTADTIAEIVRANETPLEQYRRQVAEVQSLLNKGLSADTAIREIERLGAALGEQTQALVDASEAGEQWKNDIADAARFAESAKSDFDRLADTYQRIEELQRKGLLTPEIARGAKDDALEDYRRQVDMTAEHTQTRTEQLLESIKNATDGYAKEITDIFFDTTKSIGDMFADLLNQISRMIVQQAIVEPILSSITGAIFGSFGSSSGSGGGLFRGFRAGGGPVSPGGSYIVGERGAELFIPKSAGDIVPNGAIGGTLAITFNVNSLDPRTAAAVIADNERTITNVIRRAQVRAGYRPTL